jgi:hypothetical protein
VPRAFPTLSKDKREAVSARFWPKARQGDGPEACWEWQAGKFPKGYGVFQMARRAWFAHRVAWWLSTGEDPGGLEVCHECDNPGCVQPSHLFLGSHAENMQDCVRKGRHPAQREPAVFRALLERARAAKRARRFCKHGHEFTPPNTYIRPNGSRACRACNLGRTKVPSRKDYTDDRLARVRESNRRPVQHPDGGTWECVRTAAAAAGISENAMVQRCRRGTGGWSFVDPTDYL